MGARGLDEERCSPSRTAATSGGLDRQLIARDERTVRVAPKLMAIHRRTDRTFGKSDPIDATAVARAALRHRELPEARLVGPEREIGLLASHREDLVAERTRACNRLRWRRTIRILISCPPRECSIATWPFAGSRPS